MNNDTIQYRDWKSTKKPKVIFFLSKTQSKQ